MSPQPTQRRVAEQTSLAKYLPRILIVAGVVFVAFLIVITKQAAEVVPVAAELPETQLMNALETGRPILAFFHSLTCDSCKQMTAIVNEVYPDYADSIALVDVDVYDERNSRLLEVAGIQAIPTVIFFDRSGEGKTHIGVVEADDLRQILDAMQGGG